MEIPEVLEIKSVIKENYKTKTFFFNKKIEAEPGQFLMVWIPGIDEKPFAVSFENPLGITVGRVGSFTTQLLKMKKGDKLGIRGPYGNGFKLKGKEICLVAGGRGIIPLAFLAEKFKKVDITAIVGANTKDDLFFVKRLKKYCFRIIVVTDDGSSGIKGFPTDSLKDLLEKEKFDCVYTCGPEIMMKKVFDICENYNTECQASLERYMKCGFGLCGQCCIDDIRICKDGPVFNSKQLSKLTEFGVFERDKSGKKVYF
ncbi:MAG: dihydroorotate dehydrogenase electron transfer subunit [Candidatus Aenigmarchaeota archaeon]|nr:dihydroorotate dehydrogenase electron transfer subunit [Candidatus Aenigmarchaeota archaeon]